MGTTTILGVTHTTVDAPGGLTWTEDLKVPVVGAFSHPRGMMLYTPAQTVDTFATVPGWRLPTQKELMQAYIDGSYFNLSQPSNNFWSATQNNSTNAWNVNLNNGNTNNNNMGNTNNVRCVR